MNTFTIKAELETNTELFDSYQDYKNCSFKDDDYDCMDIGNTDFTYCILDHMNLKDDKFTNCHFVEVVFKNCDLSNVTFDNTLLRRCTFINCKMTGTSFLDCLFEWVTINTSQCHYMNISHMANKGLLIEESDLSESYFNECDMKKTEITDCKLSGTEFLNSSLNKVDLSTNMIDGLRVTPRDLRGAVIAEYQAVLLIELLGLTIKE